MKNLILVLLLIPSMLFSQLKGKVIRVKDGDTIVLLKNKEQFVIRLSDIDCPEMGQPYSNKAKDFVLKKVAGKFVEIIIKGKDRYGRIIGLVKYKNKILNEELLKNGLAWHYKYFSKDLRFSQLEKYARQKKIGLWKEKNPLEPYLWRKKRNH